MKKYFQSPAFLKWMRVLGIILLVLIIFWAGMSVGYRKAMFTYHWNDNYGRQFGEHSPFSPMHEIGDRTANPHGAFGEIVAVSLPTIIVKGPAEAEKTVLIASTTVVRNIHETTTSTALKVGDTVVIIGKPDDQGRITASLIRIMPQSRIPSERTATSSSTAI